MTDDEIFDAADEVVFGKRDEWQNRPSYDFCHGCGVNVDHSALMAFVVEALRDAHARGVSEGQAWQPIETAPRDGTDVLLCVAGWKPFTGYFDRSADAWLSDEGVEYLVTHWQPLPAPPASPEDRS